MPGLAAKFKQWVLRHFASNFPIAGQIARERRKHLDSRTANAISRAIILIAPGSESTNDVPGFLNSIASESEALRPQHGAEVFVCFCPGDASLFHHAAFSDDRILFDFTEVLERLGADVDVLVHIPQACAKRFLASSALPPVARHLRFNILLHGTDMLLQRDDVAAFQNRGFAMVTATHEAHANAETQQQLGCLVHYLPTRPGKFCQPGKLLGEQGLYAAEFHAALASWYQRYFSRRLSYETTGLRWKSKYFASNYVRFLNIERARHRYLDGIDFNACSRAIILIVPGRNLVNGGIMSIIAIARESDRLRALHSAEVFVCTCPGDAPLLRYSNFPNDRILLGFKAVVDRLGTGKDVLVHVPELYVPQFVSCSAALMQDSGLRWRFNIMLQNIDMIPPRSVVQLLEQIGPTTFTTAHDAYATAETQKRLGCTMHHLSAWTSPIDYERRPFALRENIVIVSPDPHEGKEQILTELIRRLPDYQFVMIWKMPYPDYRELIAKAKFSITFGEGLDAYFSEIVFSGGIGSAVYNDRFFTEDFSTLPFVYPSWDELLARFPEDVRAADRAGEFARQNDLAHRMLSKRSSFEMFRDNLRSYYETYFPKP